MKQLIKRYISKRTITKVKQLYLRFFGHNKIKVRRGNLLNLGDALLRNCTINVHGHNNTISMGGGNLLSNSSIRIFGNNCTIEIGDNNMLNDVTLWLEDDGSAIQIGNNNNFCGKLHLGVVENTKITVKNDCLFSSYIHITTTDSHTIIDMSTGTRINPSLNVEIGNHVWIGYKVTILKGVSIASDTVIGACSVVTHSIDKPHSVTAGNPAKIVRTGINWDEKRL